jgi:hypothetical protein
LQAHARRQESREHAVDQGEQKVHGSVLGVSNRGEKKPRAVAGAGLWIPGFVAAALGRNGSIPHGGRNKKQAEKYRTHDRSRDVARSIQAVVRCSVHGPKLAAFRRAVKRRRHKETTCLRGDVDLLLKLARAHAHEAVSRKSPHDALRQLRA